MKLITQLLILAIAFAATSARAQVIIPWTDVDKTGSSLGDLATRSASDLNSGILAGANGGTGVANTGKTITLGGNLTTTGAYNLTLTQAGNTSLTLPTEGTVATNQIDVYIIGGQSNAQGMGDSTLSPVPQSGTALQWWALTLTPAIDPIGNANTGSAWPSFAVTYFAATGRKICFVPSAVGGSAQSAAADDGAGNWDSAGALYGTSVSRAQAAMTALITAGYTPVFKGVLWSQGEKDAYQINASVISKATYKAALVAMIARYRAVSEFGVSMPFYISTTGIGKPADGGDAGYAEVRAAQMEVAASDPLTRIVFRNGQDFYTRSGYIQGDLIHYKQIGYNEMGRDMAGNITSGNAYRYFQFKGTEESDAYYPHGKIGVHTTLPIGTLDSASGFVGSEPSLSIGADINDYLRTDAVRKLGSIVGAPYNTADTPLMAIGTDANTASNIISVGGGFSGFSSATRVSTYAAAAVDTATGTEITRVTTGGLALLTGNLTGGASNMTILAGSDADRTIALQPTNAVSAGVNALVLSKDNATFSVAPLPSGTLSFGSTSARWNIGYFGAISDGTDQLIGSGGYTVSVSAGTRWTATQIMTGGVQRLLVNSSGIDVAGVIKAGSSDVSITDSSGLILSAALNTVQPSVGGTGQTTFTDGQLLIGNTTGNTLAKATLTAGAGVSITNGSGSITIKNSQMSALRTGTATLVAGTVTITDAATAAGTIISPRYLTPGGVPGAVFVSAKTPTSGFVVTSTNALDTSVIYYEAFEP